MNRQVLSKVDKLSFLFLTLAGVRLVHFKGTGMILSVAKKEKLRLALNASPYRRLTNKLKKGNGSILHTHTRAADQYFTKLLKLFKKVRMNN